MKMIIIKMTVIITNNTYDNEETKYDEENNIKLKQSNKNYRYIYELIIYNSLSKKINPFVTFRKFIKFTIISYAVHLYGSSYLKNPNDFNDIIKQLINTKYGPIIKLLVNTNTTKKNSSYKIQLCLLLLRLIQQY